MTHMLIDCKNCLYRAIYAGLSDENFKRSGADYMVIFFRFIQSYITIFKPKEIHFFWDAPKNNLWRKKLYPEYKEGRIPRDPNADNYQVRNAKFIKGLVPYIGCRNYLIDDQEADDLIYAFCKVVPDKTVVVSSDGDFKQLLYMFNHITLYNPLAKSNNVMTEIDHDPVEIKCLTGEKADNISGYVQIGPVRAENIIKSIDKRLDLMKLYGRDIYIRNRKLIDLSISPCVAENMSYIMDVMAVKNVYEPQKIARYIIDNKIKGITSEVKRIILPFKFVQT